MMQAIIDFFDVEMLKQLGVAFVLMMLAIVCSVLSSRVDDKEQVIDRLNDVIVVLSNQSDEVIADYNEIIRNKEAEWDEERERMRGINHENQQLKAHRETLRGVVDNLKQELSERERNHLRACETTFAVIKVLMDKNKEG